MRLPNGYGSCYKMSGKRRRPYIARYVSGWRADGTAIYTTLGYYATKAEGLDALALNHLNPKERAQRMTFNEVYEGWAEWHYPKISEKTQTTYRSAYKQVDYLGDKILTDISQSELQAAIDNLKAISTKRMVCILFRNVWDYAVRKDIITKDQNRTEYLDCPAQPKSDKHKRFSNQEMQLLWEHSDNDTIGLILVLVYTGCRPSELFGLNMADVHDDYFVIRSGKTKNAARDIPLHKDIIPLFKRCMRYDITTQSKYNKWAKWEFKAELEQIGITDHTVYDCRHTTASLWADYKLSEPIRRKFMGHSGKGIGEEVYTHYDLEIIRQEVNMLPTDFENNVYYLHTTCKRA